MPRPERDFKGVWIPKEIWESPSSFRLWKKFCLLKFTVLDNERGCFASNRHFAEFFGVSERQIRTYINSLKKKGFIGVSIKNRNERVMRAIGKYARVRDEDLQKFRENRQALIHKWSARPPTR